MDTRFFLLTCGTGDLDQSALTPGRGAGTRVRLPIPACLLQTDRRTILFDTGMPDFCYTGNPRALAHEGEHDPPWAIPHGGAADTITGQLATLGLRPADVDLVVNSHLHLDHCGGNLHFAHCPLLLQAAELEAARAPAPGSPYEGFTGWNEPGLRYQTIQGDLMLEPGVELLATPGHTPGHQSLLLRLPNSGILLFTFDAVGTRALWQADELGAADDPAAARASVDRLRAVASQTRAQVVCGHDLEQWVALRHPPAYYD
jgi:glyoxylase-like metal-dependent hydrolase (beta-lactamase superfamily II)